MAFILTPRSSWSRLNSSSSCFSRRLQDRCLRVNHAGEFGANRIYEGQLAVLRSSSRDRELIQHMWDQEKVHLATFDKQLPRFRARPSALLPLWHVAGFALGAGTALLGRSAAMACTVAVEASITEHYNDQIRALIDDDPEANKELIDIFTKFRDEEQEHHDTGLSEDAEQAPFYDSLTSAIKLGCKGAIWLSERI